MSAQGATLRRGTTHLPIWPVTALVAAAVVAIGISTLGGVRQQGSVAPITKAVVGLENPGAYITEAPAYVGFENPGAYITEAPAYAGFENPGAYITEAPAYVGISHVSPSLHSVGFAGFENPGAYATTAGSNDGPNGALHRQVGLPKVGAPAETGLNPIMVNGEACMQCR
jgi:hypothetical protein